MGPHSHNDPYQWNVAMSRRQRRKITYGNAATMGGLSGAPLPVKQIWVSRVSRGDIRDIQDHMHRNNIDINDIEKTSHPNAKFSSYKISIPVSGSDKVFEESFWPLGVRCQKWFERSPRIYDSDSDSNNDQYDNDFNNRHYNHFNSLSHDGRLY